MVRCASSSPGQANHRHILQLVFNWNDYFDLAHELRQCDGEAHQRSAVSRAYYAIFHHARYKLIFWYEWNPPEDESDHTYLWETFLKKEDSQSKQIGQFGDRLRGVRNRMDYDSDIANVSDVVEVAMINAERLKNALSSL